MRYLDNSTRGINGRKMAFLPDTQALDFNSPPVSTTPVTAEATLGPWSRGIVIATAVWSMCELPFELWASRSVGEAAACVVAKLLWVALICFVLTGNRAARVTYGFLCTIGLMAMAFALPAEFRVFPLGFALTSVECVLKATAFVCLVSAGVYPDEE